MSCWAQPISAICAPSSAGHVKPALPPISASASSASCRKGPGAGARAALPTCTGGKHSATASDATTCTGAKRGGTVSGTTTCIGANRRGKATAAPAATSIGSNDPEAPLAGNVDGGEIDGISLHLKPPIMPSHAAQWAAEVAAETGRSPASVQKAMQHIERAAEATRQADPGSHPYGHGHGAYDAFDGSETQDTESSMSTQVEDEYGRNNSKGSADAGTSRLRGKKKPDMEDVLAANIASMGMPMLGKLLCISIFLLILAGVSIGLSAALDSDCGTPIPTMVWTAIVAAVEFSLLIIYTVMMALMSKLISFRDAQEASSKNGLYDFPKAVRANPTERQRVQHLLLASLVAFRVLIAKLVLDAVGVVLAIIDVIVQHSVEPCSAAIFGLVFAGAFFQAYPQVVSYKEMRRLRS